MTALAIAAGAAALALFGISSALSRIAGALEAIAIAQGELAGVEVRRIHREDTILDGQGTP